MASPSLAGDMDVSFTRQGPKRNLHCWSKLPQDLLQSIFERLCFADFEHAKCVCSSWQSASRQSKPNNEIPWMILFPKHKNYCYLLNPEEKDKVYKTQDLGSDFVKSFCVASYRSWLLMKPRYEYIDDPQYNLYILDLLTRERINLPTFELETRLASPILWIDEKTNYYLVIGMVDEKNAISFKREDKSWKQIPLTLDIAECFDMVYNDHKLYCLNYYKLKIFDFSGENPVQVFKISVRECILISSSFGMRLPGIPWEVQRGYSTDRIVVTVGGDVLIIKGRRPRLCRIWNFEIYKMGSSKGDKWKEIFFFWETKQFFLIWVSQCAPKTLKESREIRFTSTAMTLMVYMTKTMFSYSVSIQRRLNKHTTLFVCPFYAMTRDGFLPSFKR